MYIYIFLNSSLKEALAYQLKIGIILFDLETLTFRCTFK